MCEPTTILLVGSALLGANAQRQQGQFTEDTADYNARVAENQAQDVRNAGNDAENQKRRETAELISKQRAQIGASGVALDSGSALQLQEDAAILGEADALRIRSNTDNQVSALQTGADLTVAQGAAAKTVANQQAVGSVLGGAGNAAVAGKWFTPKSSINAFKTTAAA